MRLAQTLATTAILLILCLSSLVSAQKKVPIVDVKDLKYKPETLSDIEDRKIRLARSIVEVRVRLKLSRHIRPLPGFEYARGIATMISDDRLNGGPVLITAEFLVRGHTEVELLTEEGPIKASVLRTDLNLGLALISPPEQLLKTMPPLGVVQPGAALLGVRLFTIAHGANHEPFLFNATIEGPGEDELAFYMVAQPALNNGHPLVTNKDLLYGLYGFRHIEKTDIGLAIVGDHITAFLSPKNIDKRIKVEVRDMSKTRP